MAAAPGSSIPPEHTGATPYLTVPDADQALDFYARAFGGIEAYRLTSSDGAVVHAEMRIGDATFMLSPQMPKMGVHGAGHFGGSPVRVAIYVEDVDAFVERAKQAGATVQRPPEDQFYGNRSATLIDPFGLIWLFMTRIETVSVEEMQARLDRMFAG